MADIWPVYEGREPTRGGPWASMSLNDAIELFELQPKDRVADYIHTPRFGSSDRDLSILGFKHIVVEVPPNEERPPDWPAGFYRSPVSPTDAFNRILRATLSAVLGEANLVRVEHVASTDSRGRNTFKVTVILGPTARPRISGDLSLAAAGRIQKALSKMGVEGSPILQYATEDELIHDDQ